jgi:hypothetical protein
MNAQIIVEIPHQMPPKVWVAWDDKDIIKSAYESHDFIYQKYTLETALESWGERSEIPEEVLEILDSGDAVVEIGNASNAEFVRLSEAESELEAAKEEIFHDLYTHRILSESEARAFVAGDNSIYSGHQAIEARKAVRTVLQDYFND